MLLSQDQVEFLQPLPVQIAEAAITIAFRVALASLQPDQLQRQVPVRLQFLVDLGLGMDGALGGCLRQIPGSGRCGSVKWPLPENCG